MRQKTIKGFVFVVFFSVLFTSCAGTKLTSTQVDESFRGKPVSNILVIGVTYKDKEKVRRSFEDRFVAHFKAAGVGAISSGDAISIPSDLMLKKEEVLKAVNKFNNDAVIITHVAGFEEEEIYTTARRSSGYYGYYGQIYAYANSSGYSSTNTYYRLETNLYDVKTEKLIWSGKSETLNPDSTMQAIDDVIKVVIKDLQKNKLIPQN